MKALPDPIGLRTLHFGAGMIAMLHGPIQLVFMAVWTATILRAPIGQNAAQRHLVRLKERHHLVIKQIGSGEGGLTVIELGKAHLGVGSNAGLLIAAPHALQRPDVKRILRPTLPRTVALKLPMRLFVYLGLL